MNIPRHLGALATQLKQLVTVTGILAAGLLPLHAAFADPGSITPNNLGCIAQQVGSAKFVGSNQVDRQVIEDTIAQARQRGVTTLDPCLSGRLHYLPAKAYAALAAKHPGKFQPLDVNIQPALPANPQISANPNPAATASAPTYRYSRIDDIAPAGLEGFWFFDPIAIRNGSRVYGTVYAASDNPLGFTSYVSMLNNGIVTTWHEGFAMTANQGDTVGGMVVTDPDNFYTQAALFHENQIELIPRLPNEISSWVLLLNDPGVALVLSINGDGIGTYALYNNGRLSVLDFGPDLPDVIFLSGMNNQGLISGTAGQGLFNETTRAFRFDPRNGKATRLSPLSTEPSSWGLGINERGEVLGYSFISNQTERIGVWDIQDVFHTYFVEGTPEFPTISNALHFNDNNLIVITDVSSPAGEKGNSYLVPTPGVRLNLADLVENMPPDQVPSLIQEVNTDGNILGTSSTRDNIFNILSNFILERTAPPTK